MQNKKYLSLLFAVLFFPCLAFAKTSQLTHIQFSKGDSGARIKLVLTEKISAHVFTLSHPDRLVIDLPDTRLTAQLHQINLQNTVFKSIREGHPKPHILRLVLDLKKPIKYKTTTQHQNLLLDIYAGNIPVENTPKTEPIVIVIDPGHGGKDPGAVGQLGTKEKNVVLMIARELAKKINQHPDMRAVLTRNGDYYVPLAGRLKLARKGKADLFVAIHADSYFNNQASGVSVYALSRRGATTVAARWLSDRENHAELDGVDLRGLDDQSVQLRSVLIDLAQTATITDSLRLGTTLLDSLDEVTRLHYTRVEQAPFLVLKSPDIPSVLVETGFISNWREEEKLRDPRYQHQLAEALFNGLQKYVKKYCVAHS